MGKITRRKFIKGSAIFAGLAVAGGYGYHKLTQSNAKAKVVIVGGGAAGISVAARLMRNLSDPNVTIIDPNDTHFYQPGFTLIASGVYGKDDVYKRQTDCMPSGVNWIKDSVVTVDPEKKSVKTVGGQNIDYDFLVIASGLVCNWDGVEGISQKDLGNGDAFSIYDYEGSIKTWTGLQSFVKKGGRGVFTDTYTKMKCGGAPKKICLLTDDYARKNNLRDRIDMNYFTADKILYDVPYYTPRLQQIYEDRNVSVTIETRLKGVDTSSKKVHLEKFQKLGDGKVSRKSFIEDYDFLHFTPPMCAPNFVKEGGLAWDSGSLASGNWVMVDKETLVHKRYNNIISLGDVAGIPTSKTSAAIRKQVPIAVKNLISIMEGKEPLAKYNGYAACPIITDYGHVLLCEFDYEKNPDSSFPFSLLDVSKEQQAAWLLKVYALKPMYFYGMLKGLA